MTIDMALISQYFAQGIQIMLILALFWVAGLFMVLDKKLNAMRKGTDGIKNTIVELNNAIARAENAVLALKTNGKIANDELALKIDEANQAIEAMKFAQSAAKAINTAPRNIYNNDLKTPADYNEKKRDRLFDDLPPVDASRRNVWGGLR